MVSKPRVIIVGGGIVGCSVAYHLARSGECEVRLLERRQLTCGTTWHAAGLLGQLRATANLTRLAQYTTSLYAGLEEETGQPTGYLRTGSITLATNEERLEEIRRQASVAMSFGLEAEELAPAQIAAAWPSLQIDDVLGGVRLPGDGSTNPVDTTRALAAGARMHGARIVENCAVREILTRGGRVCGVRTDAEELSADIVVLCTGMWTHALARSVGVNVPLHAAEHFYVVTEPVANLPEQLPTLREPDACAYIKRDAGGRVLIGFFEPVAKPWASEGIPEDFFFTELPEDIDHIAPHLEAVLRRLPILQDVGIRKFFNGPEAFTPDDRYYLGEAPDLGGCFVAAGFNSIGIQSAGGAGRVLADWITRGEPDMDLWDVDIRRALPFQGDPAFLRERTTESVGLLYAMHWPARQFETGRGVHLSALHARLERAGACFGEAGGWERPNWFAPAGTEPRYRYSYKTPNWMEHAAREHTAVREGVGLFDQSSFTKLEVRGPDAEQFLNRICANDVAVPAGRIVYTQWLNSSGGIEADLTVTRLDDERFLVLGGVATRVRDRVWLERHRAPRERVAIEDISEADSVLGIMGPGSRELLSPLVDEALSHEAFPFGASRPITLAGVPVRASRITYVGELGWEIYVSRERAGEVYDAVVEAGRGQGLVHAGYHAMESLRLEKAYRHWGHDVTPDDNPLEAGLGFVVAFAKKKFVGREALLRQRDEGVRRRLICLRLTRPDALVYHDEPIWLGDRRVGQVTSGAWSPSFGVSLGLGWVDAKALEDGATAGDAGFEIEIAGRRKAAEVSLRPWYDPSGSRVRS